MTNILYIAPIESASGWGQSAIAVARAMREVGLDFTMANFQLDRTHQDVPDDLKEFCNKKLDKPDVLIQTTLPEYFFYDGRFDLNVGKFFTESNMKHSTWPVHMELMDQCWVTHSKEEYMFPNCDVRAVGEPVDVQQHNYDYIVPGNIKNIHDKFLFYTIAENTDRKNLADLMVAYFSEFSYADNVGLLIKTNDPNVRQQIDHMKKGLRHYFDERLYPPVYIIDKFLPEERIRGIHQKCHCFVTASRGEAFCRPAAEAVVFDNHVIYTQNTGIEAYMQDGGINFDSGLAVGSYETPCVTAAPPMPYIYSSRDTWYNPDILQLRDHMRKVYSGNAEQFKDNYGLVKKRISYKQVGENIKSCLGL